MQKKDIARAWKDEQYRHSLDRTDAETLPANPAGSIELDNDFLDTVYGGGELPMAATNPDGGYCPPASYAYDTCGPQQLTILFVTCSAENQARW